MPSENARERKLNPKTVMVTAGIVMGLLLAGLTLNGLREGPGQTKNSETATNNTANSSSRTTPDSANPETIDLQGSWDVVYKDRVLGPVKGRAVINSEQTSARVRLTHPQSGADHILRSTAFTRNGDRLTIELQGPWPGAQGYFPKPLGENVPIGRGSPYQSNGTGKVEVSIGNTSSVITVGDHKPVEPETVSLSFAIGSESLFGTWQHTVNAETGRTPDGGGRLGDFSYANDDTGQGIQSGPEFWVRPKPFIQMVIPVYDQMRRNEANQPSFPYPWNEKGALLSPNINRRTLFVVGTSLPTEIGEPVIIESQNEKVEYRVIAKQNDFNDQTATAPVVEDAWERIEKKLRNGGLNPNAETQLKKLKAMDGILISAKMERGAGWGATGFTLNGAEAVWTLKYGDHIGDIVITRPITQAHTEAIDFAISPEKVFVEIRTRAALPDVDQIPLLIGVNGEIQLFHQKAIKAGANGELEFVEQKRELFAKRVPIPEAEQARVDRARKNGDSDAKITHVFRSPPLALITAGEENLIPEVQGDQRLVMKAGDVLQAWLGKRYILTPTQPLAKANIVSTPIDIAPALAKQAGAPTRDENMSWPGALRKAAQCTAFSSENLLNNVLKQAYKNQDNADYQNLLTRRVYQITDWSWTEIPYAFFQKSGISTAADRAAYYSGAYKLTRTVGLDLEWWFGRSDPDVSYSVNVLLSDHAAMLLMQDVFEELMAAQLASLKKISTNDQVWEFRQRISASISAHDDHPIGDIQIASPNGDRTWFFATYNDDAMEKEYGLKGDALYFWQLRATRETLKKYIEAVEYALNSSKELGPCDVEGLLQLTAIGQENVRRYVLGRLVSSAPTAARPGNEWKADRVARSAVLGLSILGGSVKAQDEMINLDRQLFSIATAVGSMGVGASASLIGYETLSLSSLLLAIDATEVAYDSWSNLDKFFADKRELKFAKGASIVSGPTRYQQALLQDTDWYLQVVTQLLSALDFSEVIVAGPKTIGKILSTQRGKDLVVGGAGVAGSAGRPITMQGASIPIVPSTPEVRPPYTVPPQTTPTTFDPEDFTQTRNIDDLTDTVRIDPEDLTRTRNPDDFTDTVRTDPEDFTRTRDTDDVTDTVNVDSEDLTGTRNVDTSDLTGTVNVDGPPATPQLSDVRRNLQKVNADARDAENQVRDLIRSNRLGDKSEYELAALKQKIVAGNVQRELDKSINDALSNGVNEAQVSKILDEYLGVGNSTSVKNRSGAIADINLASIKAQGYEILDETDAEYLSAMLTRVQTNGGTKADVRTLRLFINEAEAQGGDFIGSLAKRGTFDQLDGYQPIASADEIKSLQKFGQDNDLIPKNTGTVNPGARIGDDPALSADDVRRLNPEQREDIFNAIVEAHRVRNAVGAKALEPAERAVLKLSDQLAVPSRGKLPDWASGLNDRTFNKISHMGARTDLKILVKQNPKAIAKIVNDPAAFDVLESQPWDSLAELNSAITKDKSRIRDPVPGFYEGVKSKQGEQKIGGMLVEDAISDDTLVSATALPGTLQSETKAFVDGNAVANFTRDVKPIDIDGRSGVEMTMSYADGKNAPRFITDTDPPLIAGRGTPLATFMNVRAFHNLNIGYADPKLLRVKMSTVVNANTAVQIDWLKRMYGAENIQKYLKHTHSVKYAESALNQAGYKITKVEIPTAQKNYKFQARRQVEGGFFHSKESPLDYLDRFGIDPDSKIESGFDIYIYVTPI